MGMTTAPYLTMRDLHIELILYFPTNIELISVDILFHYAIHLVNDRKQQFVKNMILSKTL